MSLKLKNVISKEEDLTLPIPENVTVDEIDSTIVSINDHLDEMEDDLNIIDRDCDVLEETTRDVNELEGLRDIVQTQLSEDEEYQGLDSVSSEMIRIKLNGIARRRGIDVSRISGVFSSEAFGGNIRNRRQKTEVSMEGLMSMLKGLWDKIKKIVAAIWEALKTFWKKHFTILGSLEVELQKLKKKIKNKNGYPDASKVIKAPDKMMKMYRPKSNLTIDDVGSMTSDMEEATGKCSEYLDKLMNNLEAAIGKVSSGDVTVNFISALPPEKIIMDNGELGTKDNPLINGMYGVMEIETLGESEFYSIEFSWEEADPIEYHNQDLMLPSKDKCVELIDLCLLIVKRAKHFGEVFQKHAGKTQQTMNKLTNLVNSVREDDKIDKTDNTMVQKTTGSIEETKKGRENVKSGYREVLRFYQDVMKMLPKINNKIIKGCLDTIRTDIKYLKLTVGALVDKKPD